MPFERKMECHALVERYLGYVIRKLMSYFSYKLAVPEYRALRQSKTWEIKKKIFLT